MFSFWPASIQGRYVYFLEYAQVDAAGDDTLVSLVYCGIRIIRNEIDRNATRFVSFVGPLLPAGVTKWRLAKTCAVQYDWFEQSIGTT